MQAFASPTFELRNLNIFSFLILPCIQGIIANGHAYVGKDSSVYFSTANFAAYGKLQRARQENSSEQPVENPDQGEEGDHNGEEAGVGAGVGGEEGGGGGGLQETGSRAGASKKKKQKEKDENKKKEGEEREEGEDNDNEKGEQI